ncbi:hypothetical protein D3C72_1001870 [compost metagenome]
MICQPDRPSSLRASTLADKMFSTGQTRNTSSTASTASDNQVQGDRRMGARRFMMPTPRFFVG